MNKEGKCTPALQEQAATFIINELARLDFIVDSMQKEVGGESKFDQDKY